MQEDIWIPLEKGLKQMIELSGSGEEKLPKELYMSLHSGTYNACIMNTGNGMTNADQIYKRGTMLVDEYLRENVAPKLRGSKGESLLRAISDKWKTHKVLVRWLGSVFNYIDTHYVQLLKIIPFKDSAKNSFRFIVLLPTIQDAKQSATDILEKHREGTASQEQIEAVADFVKCLVESGGYEYYKQQFEDDFVSKSNSYYSSLKTQLKLTSGDTPTYNSKAEEFLKKEAEMAKECLPTQTETRLLNQCSQLLLQKSYQSINQ